MAAGDTQHYLPKFGIWSCGLFFAQIPNQKDCKRLPSKILIASDNYLHILQIKRVKEICIF